MHGSRTASSLTLALLTATFLTPPTPAQAAPGDAQGPEFQVNTFTARDQSQPAVAMAPNGDFVVAWSGNGASDDYGVFAQRYNAAGVPQGAEFRVNTVTTARQISPAVAMDADGNFVVAWQSGYGFDDFDVFARRFDAMGEARAPEFQVNSFTSFDQDSPVVAMDADGDFVVAWHSDRDAYDSDIRAQCFDDTGAPRGAEILVNTTTTAWLDAPAVAMDADGNFVVAWQSHGGQDGSYAGIFAQRFDAVGVHQGAEFPVNSLTTNSQFDPAVAMDADGDFVVAWTSEVQDDPGAPYIDYNIFARRFDAAGISQGAEIQVNTFTTSGQLGPAVAMDVDGDFVVAWSSFEQDGSDDGIFARRYDPEGVAKGVEVRVNSFTPREQLSPAVAMDADGDLVVAWEGDNQDGSGFGIFAQRFQGDGPVAGDFTVDGRADILWRQTANGNTSLWEMDGFAKEDTGSIGSASTVWQVEGLADFNGDTKMDVLWRHTGNGKAAIWLMDGDTRLGAGVVGRAGPDWEIVGTGDFDGDDHADILWRNLANGKAVIWKMDGLVRESVARIGRPSLDWVVVGVGDLDADATSDIVWRHKTNGKTVAWKMEDLAKDTAARIGGAPLVWEVEGLADFNADAKSDILWRNTDTGKTVAWKMNGLVREAVRTLGQPDVVWRIDGLGDTNGDRNSDIIWRHTKNAKAVIWQMNGFDRQAARSIGKPPLVWEVQ